MNRRNFIHGSLVGVTSSMMIVPGMTDASLTICEQMGADPVEYVSDIPVFCAHEHWGSLDAVGMGAYGFRADLEAGAIPERSMSIWDIVLDPYFGGWIAAAGHDVAALTHQAGCDSLRHWWETEPVPMLEAVGPALREQALTGAFQCLRLGVMALHDADIGSLDPGVWQDADASIKKRYADMFGFYRQAMDMMNIRGLVRPVHPEFFWNRQTQAAEELAFTRPILRIDPFLELWPLACPRRDHLAGLVGVEPRDAGSWRTFIAALFDACARLGNVGIKQLQAYTRDLDFAIVPDEAVRFCGDLDAAEQRRFADWVVHECCRQAHERRWPHQVHVGTHNLSQSSPLPLEALARRYPNMQLVLLHCWPFLEESGFLAKHLPNVHLDPCWQNVLNPAFLRDSFNRWLGYVPASKLMCSQDATSVEMAAGSIVLLRRFLAEALGRRPEMLGMEEADLREIAALFLHGNATKLYGGA